MRPLPGALGGTELIGWRLDSARHAPSWDSGEGAFLEGGRWNSEGTRTVYCGLDPATAILEVAVHKGFKVLDTQPHILTWFQIADPTEVYCVTETDVPNPHWLRPGIVSAGQQAFGDALLSQYAFIAIPSVVSPHSWNLIFDPLRSKGLYDLIEQEAFGLDPRLHPAKSI